MVLPIEDALPELIAALRREGRAVLQAPPGAGKTTRVPLAMLEAGLVQGKIIMLEPRRLAARGASERMAETLGEKPGQTVGYRMRGETKVSASTKIEVVTEGILTRMIQTDPELSGVGAVIFDEFHERSLNADLGLALAWEIRSALRDDLVILVMSATLDAGPVASLLDNAPLVTSEGQSFPVDTRWRDKPLPKNTRFEVEVASTIRQAYAETDGSILVFLPGEGEIRRVNNLLNDLPEVRPLYGALPFAQQRAAIQPSETRKIVLATSIAETALTIQDIRVVIDAGLARRSRYDPGRGMSSLITGRVTKAEATQRSGRAGRVAPGVCYRMWTKGEDGGMSPFPPPEIADADLSGLILELALWGASPSDLAFLTPPPKGAWSQAETLLRRLGALTDTGITAHGRAIAALPIHPRLAHMALKVGAQAADIAALLNERDPIRDHGVDISTRLKTIRENPSDKRFTRIQAETKRIRHLVTKTTHDFSDAEALALAYPDRIAQRRPGIDPRYLLSGGTGAVMRREDPLAGERLLVVPDLDGGGREARIRLAIPIAEHSLRALFKDQIQWHNVCVWSKPDRRVLTRQQEKLGALVLEDRRWDAAPPDMIARAALEGIRDLGLPKSKTAPHVLARIKVLSDAGDPIADCDDETLLNDLSWLEPYVTSVKTAQDIKALDLVQPLLAHIGWEAQQRLDRLVPSHFVTPLGRKIALDYTGGTPEISVRLQEMFGVTVHPSVGPNHTPVKVTLLSPAQRPVQTTLDLPGFWAGSYADVRKDMRAQYPKHPWPEDPTQADPTLRAKRRKT